MYIFKAIVLLGGTEEIIYSNKIFQGIKNHTFASPFEVVLQVRVDANSFPVFYTVKEFAKG